MAVKDPLAREVFLEAIQIESPEARSLYVHDACGTDPSLLSEVQLLLSAYTPDSDFMSVPAPEQGVILRALGEVDAEPIIPGTLVDRYEILELIGRGGMGSVFKARQYQPVSRIVALKVVLPEHTSPSGIALFERERQTLAILNHPGIVSVLDAGQTADGRPFFVMEYFDGKPVNSFCEEGKLSGEARLNLFLSLCDSVQHAHTRGVIHQDLKPSNVLAGIVDGRMVTKLLDFGIQRGESGGTGNDHQVLHEQCHFAGTPAYVSPEQLAGSQTRSDTRSDVYSLGVVLFQLLTGKMLKECLSGGKTISDTVKRSAVCRNSWSSFRCQEVAWVIERAVDARPENRYQSVAEVAEDLRSFLAREHLRAAPPSKLYFVQRVLVRYLFVFFVAVTMVASLLAALLVSLRQTAAARTAELKALEYSRVSDSDRQRYRELAWQSSLQQAYTHWKNGEIPEARRFVQQADETLKAKTRPFESRVLSRAIQQRIHTTNFCPAAITELRVLPGTGQLVATCADGKVRLADGTTGELLREIETSIPELHSLAVSSNGQWIAVGGSVDPAADESRVQLLDSTGNLIRQYPALPTTIESLSFSPDDRLLVCGARYENPRVFNTVDGTLVKTILSERRNRWIACAPDTIMVEESTNSIRIESASSLSSQAIPLSTFQEWGCWAPKRQAFLTVLSYGGNLLICEMTSRQVIGCLSGPDSPRSFAFDMETEQLAVGSENGEIYLWDLTPLFERREIDVLSPSELLYGWHGKVVPLVQPGIVVTASDSPIEAIAIVEDRLFAGTGSGQMLSLHCQPEPRLRLQTDDNARTLESTSTLVWNPRNSSVITGHSDESVHEWRVDRSAGHLERGKCLFPAESDNNPDKTQTSCLALSISPDSSKIAWWRGSARAVQIMPLDSPAAVETIRMDDLEGDWSEVNTIRLTANSRCLALITARHLAVTELPAVPSRRRFIQLPEMVHGLCWCHDDRLLAVGVGRSLVLFDRELNVVASFDTQNPEVRTLHWNEQDGRLYTGHSDGSIRAWNLIYDRFNLLWTAQANGHSVACITTSESAGVGISADDHGQLALWWSPSGKQIGILQDAHSSLASESLTQMQLSLSPAQDELILLTKYRRLPLWWQTWTIGD